ncbi:MAG: methyltransferase domain-containing protein, partial [Deltaproteobacteria bacterium]|nr:methyltransferase domain-containing protein [Deltaproteobacteria bacterium]
MLRSEYVRDIAPRTAVALEKILREVFPHRDERNGPRRVLDLGAGTGAAVTTARSYFGNDLDVVAVDQVPAIAGVRTVDVTDVPALSRLASAGGPFDLMIAAHVLNELYLDEAPVQRIARLAALVGRWCQDLLADGGTLIVIEPALRETSRALLAVRDHLLA